jgi:hypothetical protein
MSSTVKLVQEKSRGAARQKSVCVEIPERLAASVRELASARRVPIKAIYEAALRAYLSPAAQDQRDAMLARHLNRFSRAVESVDWNSKMLIAMLAYHIELDLSFLPEPSTTEERESVSEKGARRFDRFEQWLVRHLVDSDNLYNRLQRCVSPADEDFAPNRRSWTPVDTQRRTRIRKLPVATESRDQCSVITGETLAVGGEPRTQRSDRDRVPNPVRIAA